MRIENYISDLLYRYQCVIVPGFGAFLTQYQNAKVHGTTNAFYPPSKSVSFNEQLQSNDGLLTNYLADVLKISYEEASKRLSTGVSNWKVALENEEKLELSGIGSLWLNEEGKLLFQPSYHINYLTDSFGLSSFVSPAVRREEMKKEVIELEEKVPIAFTPERRKSPSYLKYAAVALLALSVGTVGYRYMNEMGSDRMQMIQTQAQQQIERNIQQATFFDASPLEMPSVTLKVKKEPLKYHIVAGAFRVEENADKKVDELKEQGYKAMRIGKNKYGLHQVTYASFSTVPQALEYLRTIKRTVASEAWLLVDELEQN
ncbi:hypothetical protein I215_00895 [Galbibacter marinus]|uniref:SPOR domain-containing protein n=1 Tax=Galbibacter marinus TaxID=555500 RepID=K2QP71_9FLAO|nr:SPOR domain-containing protein [Galbibacter marinus]EKF56727.1 hypothetical protein I215_00895 [Galbibacter marinus]